ncbi:MAG: cell shape determination protein CcmA [Pseudorhodobacter sp. PARRP1]|nr:MAG: cell shape determination protein CcmA [Pseudorhodobacter sp. PARRP1]
MGTEMTMAEWPIAAANSAARSRLAEDLEIDGDVTTTGPIDVMGKITGSLTAPEVLLLATGRIAGQVTALDISVLGTIDGTLAAKSVLLSGSARVQADITHETIAVEAGAQFEGRLKRKA